MHLKSPMLWFLFGHGVIGGGAGIAIAVSLLAFDVAGLASLSMKSEPTWLGPFLLCFSFFASFSALAMGAAVMSFGGGGDDGDDDDGGMTVRHRIIPDTQNRGSGRAERAAIRVRK
ncbi:MAG: hypothetical protein ABJO66_05365 [Parvibaculum sp.]|uniref:hypothetical protein n=1 Tax=Alphaproteobacteria TaxID=28211 RepID=UPI0032979FBA